ncbi:MAG: acetyltransferase [Alphaproteobacteria bacterium]|nr:acetyltransferase [Alphaproteobacteria bacterium]
MQKTKRALIFGTASFAEVVRFYLDADSLYEVVAFTASRASIAQPSKQGLPVVPFEEIADRFPPGDHEMFVAVGYRQLNRLRERFCLEAKGKGYSLIRYVSSKATTWGDTRIGDNVFIFEDNTIQPFVSIGDDTILWSGNHVGHHSTIGAHCFISSHVVISGHCQVGDHCFLGVNATIADTVVVGDRNIIGPGALIQKNTGADEVYVAERTAKFPKDSSRFFR